MKVKQCDLKYIGTNFSHYPMDGKPEIAFAGKSNVGKSTLINAILGRKALARTSSQPGKTRTINFYGVNDMGQRISSTCRAMAMRRCRNPK